MTIVELNKVNICFRNKSILEDVSLVVEKGEFVALIGPNGAGKTTIIKVILGLLAPGSGQVSLFGRFLPLPREMRHLSGYLPQKLLFDRRAPLTVKDVALMGRTPRLGPGRFPGKEDRLVVSAILERVGISHLANRPIGLLSGGQQQLAFLARALAGEPRLLLLDEPTSGLDAAAQSRFYRLVKQAQQELGLTVMAVSHDLAGLVQETDRLIAVNKRVLASGPPAAVIQSYLPRLVESQLIAERVRACWN